MECGYEPAYHAFERWSLFVDGITGPLFRPLGVVNAAMSSLTESLIDHVAPVIARGMIFLHLAQVRHIPDAQDNETTQVLWHEAKRRGIDMYQVCPFGLRRRLFVAEFEGKRIAFEGLPRPNRSVRSLEWVDHKPEMKKRFLRAGFPVARGGAVRSMPKALSLFGTLSAPVITKPHIGSGGRHTTLHIMTEDELQKGFESAKRLSPVVVIEEELVGPVMRATLIGGKLTAVLRRDPPQVIGDGVRTVRELVRELNKHPLRKGPVFAKVPFEDPLVLRELSRQNLTWESVPVQNRVVFLHFKVNWGIGGTSEDVTDKVHPDNKKLFEDIARFLDDDIVGIDFIISDISQSWKTVPRCGVIECNSLPLIGNHHFPFQGEVRNVAGAIWDLIFPRSSDRAPSNDGAA